MMMENLRPEEENIIKDIKNLFRLKNALSYIFSLETDTKEIKDRILRGIQIFF